MERIFYLLEQYLNMNYNEIKERLPNRWNDVSLEAYNRILDVPLLTDEDDVADTILNLTAALINVPIDYIRSLQFNEVIEIIKQMNFIVEEIKPLKNPLDIMKKDMSLSFDSFISLNQILSTPEKIPYSFKDIVKMIVKEETTDEVILKLDMVSVYTIFFLFRKKSTRYMKTTIRYSLIKIIMNQLLQKVKSILGIRNNKK